MRKIPVCIDCDPGVDDALALMLAAASEELDIIAITTVFGNRPIEQTTKNALKLCELLGLSNVPVARGAAKGLLVPLRDFKKKRAPAIHGEDGLGNMGYMLPEPKKQEENINAIELMAKVVSQSADRVVLVPTGPLTNIAVFLLAHPELHEKIEGIALMGGAMFGGNAMPTAEANIMGDPDAAHIVFKSGVKILMCGLDATMHGYATFEDRELFRICGSKTGEFMFEALKCYVDYYEGLLGKPGCALHDSVPIAWLINPAVITTKPYYVEVDITGHYTRGCTVTDTVGKCDAPPNAMVATGIDREMLIKMHVDAFKKLAKREVL
ncbi:MAG: nucleoside hydrolase [Oscillospiraceae bacterium]